MSSDEEWENDPDGSNIKVAVIMVGEVYRTAGLKSSEFVEVEGELYDQLCSRKNNAASRDEVRRLAQSISNTKNVKMDVSVEWLDGFMRRFCLSNKKPSNYGKNLIKVKGRRAQAMIKSKKRGNEEVSPKSDSNIVIDGESNKSDAVNEKPVKSTSEPVKNTSKPIEIADKPVKNTSKPIEIADKPVETSDKPVETSDKPVETSDRPVESVEDTVKLTDEIVDVPNDMETDGKSPSPVNNKNKHNSSVSKSDKSKSNNKTPNNDTSNTEDDVINASHEANSISSITNLESEEPSSITETDADVKQESGVSIGNVIVNQTITLDSDSEEDIPTNEVNAPTSEVEVPTNELDAPTNEVDAPSNEGEVPSNEVEAPTPEVEAKPSPVKVIRLRPMAELMSSFTAEEPVVESRPATNGVPVKSTLMLLHRNVRNDDGRSVKPVKVDRKVVPIEPPKKTTQNVHSDEDESNVEDNNEDAIDKTEEEEEEESEEAVEEIVTSESSVAEVSSSNENSSDNADFEEAATKKWEAENEVKYSRKEDKAYGKSSDEYMVKLDGLLKCTSCQGQVNHRMTSLVFTHPTLGVLLCKRCRKSYGSGKFKQDSDGLDEFCRWCANGGDLLICDHCPNGFCRSCIRRNLGRSELSSVDSTMRKNKEWSCYVCDQSPLIELRLTHRAVIENLKNSAKADATKSRSEKKQSTIADKFSLLKNQRKEKLSKESPTKSTEEAKPSNAEKSTNSEPQSDDNVSDHYPWVSKCIQDFSEMLDICVHQVSRVKEKWVKNCLKNERETRLQSSRRVLRLMRAMGDNFKSLETKFLESCGDDREDLVAALGGVLENDSKNIDSKDLKKDETDSDTKAVVSRSKKESKPSESKKTKKEEPDQEMEVDEAPENGCADNGSDVEQEQEVTPKKKSGSRRRTDESPKNTPSEFSIRRSTRAKITAAVAEDSQDSDEDVSNRRRSSRSIQKPNSYLEPNAPKPKKRKRSQSDPESEEEVKPSTRTSKRSNVRTNKESEEEKSDQESSNEKMDSKRKRSSKNDKKADKDEDVENRSDDEPNEDVDDEDSKSVTKAKKSTKSADKSVSNGKKSDKECDEASGDAEEDNEESDENVKKSEEDKEENSSEIKDDPHSEETTENKEKSSDKKSESRKSKRKNNSTNNDSEASDKDIAATKKKSNSTNNGDKKVTKKVGSDNEKDAFDKMNDGDSSNGECDVGVGDDNLYDSDQHNDVEHTEESADKVDEEAEARSDKDSGKKTRTSGKESTPEKDDSGKRTSKRKKRESTVKNVDDEKANEADSESEDLEKTPSKVNKKKTKRSPRTSGRTSNRNSTQDPSESETDEEKEKAPSSKSRKSEKKSSKKSSSPSKKSKNDKEMDSDEFEKKKRAYLKKQREKEKVAEDGFSDNDSNDSDRMKLMQDITKICDMPMEEGEEDFDKIIAKAVDEQNDVKSEGSDVEKGETSDTKETKPKKREDSDSVDDDKKSTKSEIKKEQQKVEKKESQSEEEATKVKGSDEEEVIKKSSDGEKEVHKSSKKTKDGEKKSKQDNDKAKKMCLDSDSSDVELPSVKKSKVDSKKEDTNDQEEKESSKSSKSKKKYKSAATNDSNDKKKDGEESSEKKGSSTKSDEEDASLTSEKKASVDVLKLPSLLMDKIKENNDSVMVSECEDFIMADENLKTKLAMANDSSDEGGNKSSEDSEFDNLFKFKERKQKSSKKTVKSNEADGENEEEEKEESDENKKADDDDKDKIKKSKKKREKKEGLLDISLKSEEEGDSSEGIASDGGVKGKLRKAEPISLNDKIKKSLLASSDEEENEEAKSEEEDISTKMERDLIEEERKKKYEKMMERKKKKEAEKEDKEDSDEEGGQKRKKGYMSLKFSSDEENADKEESEATDGSDLETPRKSRMFIGSDSDSDFEMPTKSSKRKKKSSDSDESEEDTKSKKKRRIKMASSSSDEEEGKKDKEETPSKRKMRKIIRDEDLNESTITATQAEEQRIKRLKDRQQLYNKIFEVDVENDQTSLTSLVLDFDPETKEELVSVDPKLVAFLKPHQTEGIKFMWDATCESVERVHEEKGSGAILAHCMGLGKTLQVIVFVHTLLNCRKLSQKMNKVLVLCPVNTVYNWVAEFKNWLKKKMLTFEVTELISAKDLWNRAYRLDEWHKESGVVIMGYDMYRTLCGDKNKKIKGRMKEIFQRTLVNPGPDLVICDEGHILKNEKTALALAVNKMNTARRVVLTGTPLQNNLSEYHCMIQFVKPNLLGTRKEFMNRFVNPIQAGGSADATPRDVKRMKRRAHILHDLLSGCVQRFDYSVLQPFLPPKMEYVISVQMSALQKKLYYYYLENLSQKGTKKLGSGLFVDFNCLGRVWTHPKILGLHSQRAVFDDDEEELDDFVCDDTTSESSEDDRPSKKKKKNGKGSSSEDVDASKPPSPEEPARVEGLTASGSVKHDWWRKVVAEDVDLDTDEENWLNKIELSGKLTLLLDILRECSSIGDKVLLFSQSILALDMIEEFLHLIDKGQLEMPSHADSLPLQYKYWKRERDYLRLDGQVSAEIRQNQCKHFNDPKNERCRLFLISTRAGGIGINLVAANRVIIFDSSWNPAHDTQSIYRVYRFGQKKPVYVYRFVAQGTMEEKIYSRQVNKISTSLRVVDEHQIKRYFNSTDLDELYEFNPADEDARETPIVPEDRLLAELIIRHSKWIVGYHEHDSLLENQEHEELTEEERKAAWEDFENEKKGLVSGFDGGRMNAGAHGMNIRIPQVAENVPPFDFNMVYKSIYEQNPHLPPAQLQEQLLLATRQIQKIHLTQYQQLQSYIYNIRNPMLAPHLQAEMNIKDVLPKLQGQLKMLEENIRRENNVISRFSHLTVQGDKNAMRSAGLMYGNPSTSSAAHSSTMASTQRTPNRRTNWQDNNAGKVRVADGNQKMMVGGSSSMVVPYQRSAKKPVTVGRGAGSSGQSSMIMAAIKAAAAKKKNAGGDAEIVTLDD